MCGIYGRVSSNKDVSPSVFSGLKDIEYRGYDSWGIGLFSGYDFKVIKKIGFLPDDISLPYSSIALGHTRWATHGGVTVENSHPHGDCHNKILLVHNGIVENHLALKKTLNKHTFKSDTDSEVITHLIEEELKVTTNLTYALSEVFKKIKGLNAIVATDGNDIVCCKIGSPLIIGKLADGFSIASDPNSLLPLTRELLFLEDGQLASLNSEIKLYSYKDMKTISPQFSEVDWEYSSAHIKNFPHFMIKEIYEQPEVLQKLVKKQTDFVHVAELIKSSVSIFFVGCGSAYFACLSGTYLFSRFARRQVCSVIGSEFSYIENYLTDKDLLVAVSQSGETIDVVEPVTAAKARQVKIVSMTNTIGSTIYRMSDNQILLNAGLEKAVCSTKAFIAMLGSMIFLSFIVAGKENEGKKIIQKSVKEIQRIISCQNKIASLADKIYQVKHVYILGKGLSFPVALESALKIKEICYIHAEGFAAGELKHGVIALIEKSTPVIVFVPNDETYDGILAAALEVKARGAYVIGVSFKNNPVFDYFFEVKTSGASSMIPNVVFSQLLAYFISLKLKINPDKPRNLAKSVVVR